MMMPSVFRKNIFDEMMDFPYGDDFFGQFSPKFGKRTVDMMKTDVKESDNRYEVNIDLPGFKKEDINARLEDGYLTIDATKDVDNEESDKDGKYIRRERYQGRCSRSFYVGNSVTQEDVKAKFEDGILKLEIPKKQLDEVTQQNYIAIEG